MFEAPIGGHRCAKGPQCGTSKYKDQSYLYLGTFVCEYVIPSLRVRDKSSLFIGGDCAKLIQ